MEIFNRTLKASRKGCFISGGTAKQKNDDPGPDRNSEEP
jgi:hypothetical protein